jgi:hypothetical protein
VNYGFEEKPSRFALMTGGFFGALMGLIGAFFAFLVATAIFIMIGDALPALRGIPALIFYIAFLLVPALAFSSVLRTKEARFGPRVMAVTAIVVLTTLGVGEVTGLFVIYPRNMHFFITPGPF